MHQFLNQLLAKKNPSQRDTGLPSSQLTAELGTCSVSRREGACPTFPSVRNNWEHWEHRGFTGRSLDGPRSSFTANHWYFTSGAWSSLIL